MFRVSSIIVIRVRLKVVILLFRCLLSGWFGVLGWCSSY